MERNFDLKDALRGGITPEQMLADFQKQLAEAQAQAEVATEQAAAKDELEDVRADMVDFIIEYLVTIGLIDKDEVDIDEMADDLVEAIKEVEKEIAATKPLLDMLRSMKVENEKPDRNPDAVIGEFLRTLR